MTTLPFAQRPTDTPRSVHPDDAMLEFASETGSPHKPHSRKPRTGWVTGIVGLLLLTAAGVWAFRSNRTPPVVDGTLRVESVPAGAAVEVDGSVRGLTPLTLTLAPGAHAVVVSLEAQKQEISATIAKGIESVHHVRFAAPTAAPARPDTGRGRLQVLGDVSGAAISVDGVSRGTAPLTIDGLEPGEHHVVIEGAGKTQRRTVTISAGATASLVITNAPAGAESGWMSVKTSTPLLIYEKGVLIGTTEADRIMLPAGAHNLEFVADPLGFRARRNVTVASGQTTTTSITLPKVPANLNAVPWAEVTIDGVAAGQTPIANHLLTIGAHVVEFRHPSFGTKKTKITVTLSEPAKVAVDMRTP